MRRIASPCSPGPFVSSRQMNPSQTLACSTSSASVVLILEPLKNFLDIYKLRCGNMALSEGQTVYFHDLRPTAWTALNDVSEGMRANASDRQRATDVGEIERVRWLRATDQRRRIDASLLTEGYERNWSVRAQGEERSRQDHLLRRSRRQFSSGRTKRGAAAPQRQDRSQSPAQ
jgi:hypothetical protein